MKRYFCYKVLNLITGKFYIGVHSTVNVNDNYMGSGLLIKRSIIKYGIDNHKKTIIAEFDTKEDMYKFEKVVVNNSLLNNTMCMNLKVGGSGGLSVNQNSLTFSRIGVMARVNKIKNNKSLKQKLSDSFSKRVKEYHKLGMYKYDTFTGKKHTEETKSKISDKNKIKQKGENNSQFGTIWITNGTENKKINKDAFIPDGFRKGRVIGVLVK